MNDDNDAGRMTLDDFLNDYDWCGSYERQEGAVYESAKKPDPLPGFSGPVAWGRDDVAAVLASSVEHGDYAETDCAALLRLTDGRHVFMSASCDTTGWDCQAGGRSIVGDDKDALIRLAMTGEERGRLGLA